MAEEIVFCKGGGCTAKLGPDLLSHVLDKLPRGEKDPNLLIGYDSKDDAAVYRVSDEVAVVQTLDFFPPMLDDPSTRMYEVFTHIFAIDKHQPFTDSGVRGLVERINPDYVTYEYITENREQLEEYLKMGKL